jgi:hypothetical protein
MADLEYSVDALNVKHAFYRAETMVYVEGEDDVLFWDVILSQTTNMKYEIESVGGSAEIDKYIAKLETAQLLAIVARDSDLLPLLGKKSENPCILYTIGYSIENSLYTVETLLPLAKSWCKSTKITEQECRDWFENLSNQFLTLLQLDLANAFGNAGVQTIGDNCTRFMKNQSSAQPCNQKIERYVNQAKALIAEDLLAEAELMLGDDLTKIGLFLRGHFLQSAVIKFLANKAQSYGKKATVSADALYAAALAIFKSIFSNHHPHYGHYVAAAVRAEAAL